MLKYEGAVTNVATGLAFVAGAMGEKPIIQEVAEQRGAILSRHTRNPRLLSPLHPRLGRLLLCEGRVLCLDRWTLPMLEAMALRSVVGSVTLGLMIALSVTQGRRLFFLCRRLGLLPKPDAPSLAPRRPGGPHDHWIDEAAAMLADVETVVARVKQSRVYRNAALIIILWGAVDLVRDLLIAVGPAWFAPRWFLADAVGVVGTIALLRFGAAPAGRFPLRILAAFALFYAFGWIWSQLLGHFGPREEMAFWPTLSCSATR